MKLVSTQIEYGHVFVSIKGSSYVRFRRALDTAAAAELPQADPREALGRNSRVPRLGREPERFERALVSWHARYSLEKRPGADEAQLVLAALRALAGPTRAAAAHALAAVLENRGLAEAPERLEDIAGTG